MLSVFTLFCCFQQEKFERNLWEIIGVLNFFHSKCEVYFAQFLYKYIKADTQKNTSLESKPAEEIPRIFKMLGYVGKAKIKEEFSLFPSQGSYYTISENDSINYIYIFQIYLHNFFLFLSYPFTISKSNLHSVGSPHAWPMVLGALCWLIELIKVNYC